MAKASDNVKLQGLLRSYGCPPEIIALVLEELDEMDYITVPRSQVYLTIPIPWGRKKRKK